MAGGTVALLGNLSIDRKLFDSVASEFELTVDQAPTLGALRDMCGSREVSAVVFDARSFGLSWHDALESVLGSAPRALPVLCAGFAESIPWPELAEAGAFHVLRRPIKESEARHTLGFIWAAKRWDGQQKKAAGRESQSDTSRQPAMNRFVAKG
jgi:DNA-binding NtrC family response regulator